MAIITCTPCIASTLGPTALGTLTAMGIYKERKKKGRKKKKTIKKRKKQRGGSGMESKEDFEKMMSENERLMDEQETYFQEQRKKKEEQRKKNIKTFNIECSEFLKFIQRNFPGKFDEYYRLAVQWKDECAKGDKYFCELCKNEYSKKKDEYKSRLIQNFDQKKEMTPHVPEEAKPPERFSLKVPPQRKGKRIDMRNQYLLHAAQGNLKRKQKIDQLRKKILNERISIPKSKNKMKRTKSIGGKRSKKRSKRRR